MSLQFNGILARSVVMQGAALLTRLAEATACGLSALKLDPDEAGKLRR